MNKVGSYRVIGVQRLLFTGDQQIWMEFLDKDELIKLNIVIETSDDKNAVGYLRADGKGDHSKVTFGNWRNPAGQATIEPLEIGTTNAGKQLAIHAASWLIGTMRIIEVQVMVNDQ